MQGARAWLVLAGLGLAGAGWLAWAWLVLAGWLGLGWRWMAGAGASWHGMAEQVIGFDYKMSAARCMIWEIGKFYFDKTHS